jgi:hypothetical protein
VGELQPGWPQRLGRGNSKWQALPMRLRALITRAIFERVHSLVSCTCQIGILISLWYRSVHLRGLCHLPPRAYSDRFRYLSATARPMLNCNNPGSGMRALLSQCHLVITRYTSSLLRITLAMMRSTSRVPQIGLSNKHVWLSRPMIISRASIAGGIPCMKRSHSIRNIVGPYPEWTKRNRILSKRLDCAQSATPTVAQIIFAGELLPEAASR